MIEDVEQIVIETNISILGFFQVDRNFM